MKLGTKRNTENIQQVVQQSRNFETSMSDSLKKSERRAWMVTWGAITVAALLAGGYIFMIPLKKEVPYLVLADAQTGTSTVARLNEDFSDTSVTSSEAINKSNVAHFVIARESYDWDLIGRRDWNTVYSMAGLKVAAEYKELFSDISPNNPDKVWGQKSSVRVKIKSIVLLGATGPGTAPTGATVRFERILVDNQSARAVTLDHKIATIAFTYKGNLKMSDEARVENPMGFQVVSYRVDNDAESAAQAATTTLNNNSGTTQSTSPENTQAPVVTQPAPTPSNTGVTP